SGTCLFLPLKRSKSPTFGGSICLMRPAPASAPTCRPCVELCLRQRHRDEDDFLSAGLHTVADGLAVLLAHLTLTLADAADEAGFGDVVDRVAERALGSDVFAEQASVVVVLRLRSKRGDQRSVDAGSGSRD